VKTATEKTFRMLGGFLRTLFEIMVKRRIILPLGDSTARWKYPQAPLRMLADIPSWWTAQVKSEHRADEGK